MFSSETGVVGDLRAIARRISDDFAVALPQVRRLSFISYEEWEDGIGGTDDVLSDGVLKSPAPDIVCVVGGRSFSVPTEDGPEHALRYIADQLQDDAMDRLRRPWPEVETTRGPCVLTPDIDGLGRAVWSSSGGVSCPIGYLHTSLGVAGALGSEEP